MSFRTNVRNLLFRLRRWVVSEKQIPRPESSSGSLGMTLCDRLFANSGTESHCCIGKPLSRYVDAPFGKRVSRKNEREGRDFKSRPNTSQHKSRPIISQHKSRPNTSQHRSRPNTSQHKSRPNTSQHKSRPIISQHKSRPNTWYTPTTPSLRPSGSPHFRRRR